jgi:asparagine synthase (glutamine-hydrolysing)
MFESEDVSLGAVRLKIIDLSGGDQPIFSDDLDTVVVFNGEIYNHRELRAELEAAGHNFCSRCDTEVVLRAFLQWDKECFQRFRGMFAVAIWTQRAKRLLLARDRLGIKPLYIHRRGEEIYFGSELKAIFAHPEIDRSLDHKALEYFLALNYVPGPYTLVQGIEKLRPGHVLEWKDGRTSVEPYWQLRFEPQEGRSIEEAREELDDLLRESVREHLVSDVPLGIWISGGLDSSTILHYARSANSARLKTFSITFLGRSFDESRYIREMAREYETEHYEMDLNPGVDLAGAVEELAYYSDEPFADAGALPVWYLAKLSRQQVTVALSGEGADELFGGYITYRADRLRQRARFLPRQIRRGLVSLLRTWPVSDEKISFEYKLKRFFEGTLLPPDEAHAYWNGAFSHAQQSGILVAKNGTRVTDLFTCDLPQHGSRGSVNRYLAFDQQYYLPDDILQKVDRMSMAHSLEVRPPFLDHRIAEFAARLPEKWKIRGGYQKAILRDLMKEKLPLSTLNRPKSGLDIPTHDWFRGVLRPLLLDTLNGEALEETKLFRKDDVESLIRQHLERRGNFGYHLWGLLILFLWIKQWNIRIKPALEMEGMDSEAALALA